MITKRKQYLSGLRAATPVILGFIPVGIAYAIMARQAGFSVFETVFMSISVFAGASQMMAVGMYAQGASVALIIFATLILNLRHLIMSTCVVNRIRGEGIGKKLLAAFGVTDESFAIFTTLPEEKCTIYFFFGLITGTYSSWITGSAIGAVASDLLPEIVSAALGISLYAMFLGLLVPSLTHNIKLTVLMVMTAVLNSVLSLFLDSAWALIVSTLVCAFVGVFFVDLDKKETEGAKNES